MSFSKIQGTPAQISLWFVPVDGGAPPKSHPLGEVSGSLLLDILLAEISPSAQSALNQLLSTPLDQVFDAAWQQLQADPATNARDMVVQAIQGAISGAYGIQVNFPTKGTLQAQASPPDPTSPTLTLQYLLPGVTCSFSTPGSGIWGGWADPAYNLSFDATLEINVWAPTQTAVPLRALPQLAVTNMQAGPGNAFAVVSGIWSLIGAWWNGQTGSGSSLQDQMLPINIPAVQQLFSELSSGFATASEYGFVNLGVQINTSPLAGTPPGNTVEFDLTYPWGTPGPGIVGASGGPPATPNLLSAQLVASFPQVNAGGTLAVTGSAFPAGQAAQLTISWGDVTSGGISQSEVQWGPAVNGEASPAASVKVARTSSGDDANFFTAGGAAAPLTPSTPYAFRVRDYDVDNLVASDWGSWATLTTMPTDQVDLVLGYESTTVGTATLTAGGSFSGSITIPATVPPGAYLLGAVLSGQQLAQTAITVIGAHDEVPAVLQFIDAATGVPYSDVLLITGSQATVAGANFRPGNVDLFIDSPSGTRLGAANVGFNGAFTFTLTWPGTVGAHTVHAQQAADSADAPLFAEMPAK